MGTLQLQPVANASAVGANMSGIHSPAVGRAPVDASLQFRNFGKGDASEV